MKKLLCLLLLSVFIAGCSPATADGVPADISGIVYSIDDHVVLVVEGIDSIDVPYDEWFEKGNKAIFFTIDDKTKFEGNKAKTSLTDLKEGQEVRVWSTGPLAKSYPMQGTAKTIVID